MLRVVFTSILFILLVQRAPIVSSIDVQILAPPAVVAIAGQRHLVYELHLTNFRSSAVTLTSIDVIDADRNARLATLRDETLVVDRRTFGAKSHAVVYVWLPLDNGAAPPPARLRHRIVLDVAGPAAGAATSTPLAVDADPVAVRQQPAIELDPPLRGGPWVALYDPRLIGGHRTAIYALGGHARIAARFAIDFVRLSPEGARARGDASRIANWYGYGADVLAVADGVVADAKQDLEEWPTLDPRTRVALENVSGNFICLDLGDGRFAFYEHLKMGSLHVKPGDRVSRGQVIASLGNTGSSSAGPHLHFHVADSGDELAAEGLPYVFTQFNVVGAFADIGAFTKDQGWTAAPPAAAGLRISELPAANVVVNFPLR
jgi:murein DD-endopeptidase